MIQIVILDDETLFRDLVSERVSEYLNQKGLLYEIAQFDSGESIMHKANSFHCDIAFLDINLGSAVNQQEKMNGLEIASRLKLENPSIVLIFISAYIQYAPKSFFLRADRYILKNNFSEYIEEALDYACTKISLRKNNTFPKELSFPCRGKERCIPIDSIQYFESDKRRIYIYSESEQQPLVIYGKMDEIEGKVKGLAFIRCHQSYLINFKHILKVNNSLFTIRNRGKAIPISKSKKEVVYREYLKLVGEIS